jgi:opacity protein-like surface antigen
MKHIQLNGSKFHSSSPATDTKLELVREAIDSLYRIEEGNYPFSPASPNRKGHLSKFTLLSIAAICGPLLAGTSSAADDGKTAIAPATLQKPAWLTDLSIGVKESYDDNVFYGGTIPAGTTYVPVVGSTEALKGHWSWVTTVSPKVGFNFAPLLGDQKALQALTFGYAPDFVSYHNAESESYNIHRISTAIKGKSDAFSYNLENGFNYIDGNKYGAVYPGSYLNAYSTGTIRERREQFQDRAKITLQYDWEKWFLRPNATLLYYDLLTKQINSSGYQNYADRYDVNGGADVGYKLQKDLALTVGYRYGHQNQEKYPFITTPAQYSSPSDYNRVLFGIEGKPAKWLAVSVQAGPDFRNYAADAQVKDRDLTTYYGEAAVTVTPTTKDTIAFKYKQWQWVSSTGRIPYFDSLYDLSYARKLTDALSLTLGGRLVESDYTSANNPNGPAGASGATIGNRDDVQYTLSAGLRYAFNSNFSADLGYSYDFGRNVQDGLSTIQQDARKYDHQLVSLGVTVKF